MKKAHIGVCRCGAVRCDADVDPAAGSARCNCSFCSSHACNWSARIKPENFRPLSRPIIYCDGHVDCRWSAPAETRHL